AITPAESVLVAATKVSENYGRLIEVAVGVPTRITLPVENDKYNTLCDRAEEVLEGLIKWATGGIPFISKVIELATTTLLKGVKLAFCYEDSDYPPPSTPMEITRMLPMDPVPGGQCEDDRSHLKEPSQACQDWEEVLRQRHPEQDGDCIDPKMDTQRARTCSNALVGGRLRCQPNAEPNITSYSWSEQELEETVVFDPISWTWKTEKYEYKDQPVMHNTDTYDDAKASFEKAQADAKNGTQTFEQAEAQQSRKADKGKPCDDGNLRNLRYSETPQPELLWSPWNLQPTWDEFPVVARPVCDKRLKAVKDGLPNAGDVPPETPDHRLPPGFNPGPYTLRYPTVKQVYGCSQKATIEMTFPSDWTSATAAQGGDDKAPQKMEEDVELGSETFQIRGFAIGGGRPERIDQGLRQGAFERNVQPESWVPAARVVGKVAVAQAEYYFNHNGTELKDPKDWMWSMDWRARLVRFRLPGSEDEQQNDDKQGGDMSLSNLSSGSSTLSIDLSDVPLPPGFPNLESFEQLIVH
ncbi:MAG: hypothetical protein ABI895_09220, partial [Deltaproteobacteria bacterium]